MKILLLSAYDTASHQYWRQGLVSQFVEHDWTVLTLPARYFAWRLRGNSLSWAYTQRALLEQHYDLLIATSMTDLSALRGLVPQLCNLPSLVYFHENQFDYPLSPEQKRSQAFNQSLNLYTALCADRVAFNSHYNHDSYFRGVKQFLKHMPDHVPAGLIDTLLTKSEVLPVPLSDHAFLERPTQPRQAGSLLWNHRWEYDKAPERFFNALKLLKQAGTDFTLHVVGHQFRQQPVCFSQAKIEFEDHIHTWGTVDDKTYQDLLRRSDIVVSTALHDFQGLSILEAMAAGCTPAVPDRLAYREFVEASFRYASNPTDAEREAESCADRLACLLGSSTATRGNTDKVQKLRWSLQKQAYTNCFMNTLNSHQGAV